MPWLNTVELAHNKVTLALHHLRDRAGAHSDTRPLLLLHGLGSCTPIDVPADVEAWPGPIWGLDFTGHGGSTVPRGGGYTCELLLADADLALAHLGSATLWGRGLGGYVAVLVAGARPTAVRGAIVADGPGMAGGGEVSGGVTIATVEHVAVAVVDQPAPPATVADPIPSADPYALAELTRDPRPPSYAAGYAREAVKGAGLDAAIVVCAEERPPWLSAVAAEEGVVTLPPDAALRRFA